MKSTGQVEVIGGEVICAQCRKTIHIGEDAVVAMDGYIGETLEGGPHVTTFDYKGVYHPTCFSDSDVV